MGDLGGVQDPVAEGGDLAVFFAILLYTAYSDGRHPSSVTVGAFVWDVRSGGPTNEIVQVVAH